jgi:hypothetical protein
VYSEGQVILNWEVRPSELRVHDFKTGSQKGVRGYGKVKSDDWVTLSLEVYEDRFKLLADNNVVYEQKGDYKGITAPIGISTNQKATVQIRSLRVGILKQ